MFTSRILLAVGVPLIVWGGYTETPSEKIQTEAVTIIESVTSDFHQSLPSEKIVEEEVAGATPDKKTWQDNPNGCEPTRIRADNLECLPEVAKTVESLVQSAPEVPSEEFVQEYGISANWTDQCHAWASQAGLVLDASAIRLIEKESTCNPYAQNPTSTAYGIGQFLDGTWARTGCSKSSDPVYQLGCMHTYVMNKYGSWSGALAHSDSIGWY